LGVQKEKTKIKVSHFSGVRQICHLRKMSMTHGQNGPLRSGRFLLARRPTHTARPCGSPNRQPHRYHRQPLAPRAACVAPCHHLSDHQGRAIPVTPTQRILECLTTSPWLPNLKDSLSSTMLFAKQHSLASKSAITPMIDSLSLSTMASVSAPQRVKEVYPHKLHADVVLQNRLTDRKIIERFDAARKAERQRERC
jgi:hypothetical protein